MKPILYSNYNCPHSLKVAIFLTEKGVDFHRVEVDLSAKEQKTPAYLAKNPRGTVPAYEDERGVICDSLDIMRYIDNTVTGKTRLFPEDYDQMQTVLGWIQRADTDFWDVSHHLYWQLIEPPETGTDLAEVARLREKGIALLTELEALLSVHPYVMGETLTTADFVLVPWVYGYQRFNLPENGHFPYVERWRDTLTARPSFVDNHRKRGQPFSEVIAPTG